MNYDYENKQTRKKYLVISIKRDKEDIKKHTLIAAASALVVGIGALGIYYFGSEVIGKIFSDDSLTFKSSFLLKLKCSGLGISVIASGLGIYCTVEKIKEIVGDVKDMVSIKKILNKLENDEKGMLL